MTPELEYLVWSVVLLIIHIAIQASGGVLKLGLSYAASPQDEQRQPDSVIVRRINRALHNFLQTYPAFIALALTLAVTQTGTTTTALGAALWFWSRIVYVIIYAAGVSWARTAVWALSIIGLLMMLWPLLLA